MVLSSSALYCRVKENKIIEWLFTSQCVCKWSVWVSSLCVSGLWMWGWIDCINYALMFGCHWQLRKEPFVEWVREMPPILSQFTFSPFNYASRVCFSLFFQHSCGVLFRNALSCQIPLIEAFTKHGHAPGFHYLVIAGFWLFFLFDFFLFYRKADE